MSDARADGSKPDETPVARAVSSIIRRARARTNRFPGKTSLLAAMSGWSFRLSLDHPAVGVARGGDEASLGRGERGPRARLVERADGSGGDEDQEREEAKRPVFAAPGGRSEKEDAGFVVCGPLPKLWQ